MTPLVDAPPAELVGFLVFLIGWNGGELPVFLNGRIVPDVTLRGDVEEIARELGGRAKRWDHERSCQVEIGLPRTRTGVVAATSVLWATIDSRDSARRCARFRPLPSMVLKLGRGAKRIVLWGLRESVPGMLAESGNKQLAYRLRAPYRMVDPDKLRVPLPGTFLRMDRARPAPVLVTLADHQASYGRSQVVARLKDPPRPWAERMREKGAWS